MPACFGASGSVRARQEHVVGVLGLGRPDLLAVDHPLVAVELGARREGGEVAARVRLAEPLAPGRLAVQDPRQEPVLLLLGAPLQDRRADEGVAEEVGAQRCLGAGELLVEDHALEGAEPLALVLGRPARADPAALVEPLGPLLVEPGPLLGRHRETLVEPALREVLLEPRTDLRAERLCLLRVAQVHRRSVASAPQGLRPANCAAGGLRTTMVRQRPRSPRPCPSHLARRSVTCARHGRGPPRSCCPSGSRPARPRTADGASRSSSTAATPAAAARASTRGTSPASSWRSGTASRCSPAPRGPSSTRAWASPPCRASTCTATRTPSGSPHAPSSRRGPTSWSSRPCWSRDSASRSPTPVGSSASWRGAGRSSTSSTTTSAWAPGSTSCTVAAGRSSRRCTTRSPSTARSRSTTQRVPGSASRRADGSASCACRCASRAGSPPCSPCRRTRASTSTARCTCRSSA